LRHIFCTDSHTVPIRSNLSYLCSCRIQGFQDPHPRYPDLCFDSHPYPFL
jgi:hypothetical protein